MPDGSSALLFRRTISEYKESHQFAYDILMGFRQMAETCGFEVDVVPVDIHTQRQSMTFLCFGTDTAGAFVIGFSLGEPWMKDFQTTRFLRQSYYRQSLHRICRH